MKLSSSQSRLLDGNETHKHGAPECRHDTLILNANSSMFFLSQKSSIAHYVIATVVNLHNQESLPCNGLLRAIVCLENRSLHSRPFSHIKLFVHLFTKGQLYLHETEA